MATLADVFVRARLDSSRLGPELKKEGERHGRVFGGTFARSTAGPLRAIGGILSTSIGGLVAGLGAVAGIKVFAGFIADAQESAKVSRLTESTIRATGGAAKITAQAVGNLATAISNKTGKDDEAIQSGQNMLLTFKGIRNEAGKNNDIFNQASSVLTDMVAAMNGGVVSEENMRKGGIQLGKALNDPIKGITALQRVGVTFTDAQKKQIAAMVKVGDVAGAQKVILGELKSEFGGAAAATSSATDKMKVALGNLGETIGGFLLPVVNKLVGFVTKSVVPGFMALFAAFQEGDVTSDGFVGGMERIGVAARTAFQFFRTAVLPRLREFAGFVRDEVIPRLIALGQSIAVTLIPIIVTLAGFIRDRVLPVLKTLGEFLIDRVIPAITAVVKWLGKNREVLAAFGIAIAVILVPAFIAWAVSAATAAAATIAATFPIIAITVVIAALVFGIIKLVQNWDKIWGHIWAFMKKIGAWFAGPFVDFFQTAWKKIKDAALAVFNWLKANWPLLVAILLGPFGIAVLVILKHWKTIRDGILAGWNFLRNNVFNPIKTMILSTIPNAFRDGVKFIGAWWNGLKAVAKAPVRFVVETVINKALIGTFNKVSGFFHGPKVPQVGLPKGFGDGPGLPPRGAPRGAGDGFGFDDVLGFVIAPARWLGNKVGAGRIAKKFGNSPFTKMLVGGVNQLKDSAADRLLNLIGIGTLGANAGAALGEWGGGGIGGGALALLRPMIRGALLLLRSAFGTVPLISGYRPGARTLSGNLSYHALGRAIDIPPVYAWAAFLNRIFRPAIKELITPWQSLNLLNGQPHRYTGAVWNQHNFAGGNAHIHAAMAGGGIIREPVFGVGRSGRTYSFGERGIETVTPGRGLGEVHFHFHGPISSKRQAQEFVLEAYNQLVKERRIRP